MNWQTQHTRKTCATLTQMTDGVHSKHGAVGTSSRAATLCLRANWHKRCSQVNFCHRRSNVICRCHTNQARLPLPHAHMRRRKTTLSCYTTVCMTCHHITLDFHKQTNTRVHSDKVHIVLVGCVFLNAHSTLPHPTIIQRARTCVLSLQAPGGQR